VRDVVVYWRPGCYFCQRLLRELEAAGLEVELRNIWEDPDAATFVRSVARGHETVPTVTIDGEALVNPDPRLVVDAVRQSPASTSSSRSLD
jgi:glutaredoxin